MYYAREKVGGPGHLFKLLMTDGTNMVVGFERESIPEIVYVHDIYLSLIEHSRRV